MQGERKRKRTARDDDDVNNINLNGDTRCLWRPGLYSFSVEDQILRLLMGKENARDEQQRKKEKGGVG